MANISKRLTGGIAVSAAIAGLAAYLIVPKNEFSIMDGCGSGEDINYSIINSDVISEEMPIEYSLAGQKWKGWKFRTSGEGSADIVVCRYSGDGIKSTEIYTVKVDKSLHICDYRVKSADDLGVMLP